MASLDDTINDIESSIGEDTGKHCIRQLFDKVSKTEIPLKTELTDNEIKLIVRLKSVASECKIPIIDVICDNFMKHRISLGRKGRTELCDAIKQVGDNKFGARQFSMFGQPPPMRIP